MRRDFFKVAVVMALIGLFLEKRGLWSADLSPPKLQKKFLAAKHQNKRED